MITLDSFASKSVAGHLVRGVLGLALLITSFVLAAGSVGPVALLIAPLGVVALRGCPTCWAIGLAQTVSRGRLERACAQDVCRVAPVAEPLVRSGS